MGIGDWGLGIGDWGLGIGPNPQTMAPTVVINMWMVHFSVGYEIVPKFKELNGINFGIGLSIPASNTNKWTNDAEKYYQNKKNKNNRQ